MRSELLQMVRGFCDTLIRYQELGEREWRGGIICPACKTIHGRSGDAIFPLALLYIETGENRYLEAMRALTGYMRETRQSDGSWLNELSAAWKGTTVFQLLSLCHAWDVLRRHGHGIEAQSLEDLIAGAACWVSDTFGEGGKTNVNYYISSALALEWAARVVPAPHYRKQARRLMERYALAGLNRDGFLLGEKTAQRPYSRITSTVDIGYNLDMSLGAMAEYALLVEDEQLHDETVRAVRAHLHLMAPDGSIDNSFGSRNYKWTMYGSKTAHGCQMAFLLLCDREPAFYRAAGLNADYLRKEAEAHDYILGYGPHYWELFQEGCIHSSINRADALAVAVAYGRTSSRIDAPIPAETSFGVHSFLALDVHQLRGTDWMASVSCCPVYHAVTGGAVGYLWHERLGPVQLGGVTRYERYELFNMPEAPCPDGGSITARIEAEREGARFTNLYEFDAAAVASMESGEPQIVVHGKLKREVDGVRQDCGVRYQMSYSLEGRKFVKVYVFDVQLPCDDLAVIEPIISRSGNARMTAPDSAVVEGDRGGVRVEADAQDRIFRMDETCLRKRAVSVFPSVITVPLRWHTGPLVPGTYKIRVAIEPDE